jgi:hypothetical protein
MIKAYRHGAYYFELRSSGLKQLAVNAIRQSTNNALHSFDSKCCAINGPESLVYLSTWTAAPGVR